MAVCDNYGHGYPVFKYPTVWHLGMKSHETNAAIISHLVTFQGFAPLFTQRHLTLVQFVQLCNHHMTSPNIPPTMEGQVETNKSAKLGNICKYVHIRKLTWNLKIPWKSPLATGDTSQNHHFFGFHVNFPGCKTYNTPKKLALCKAHKHPCRLGPSKRQQSFKLCAAAFVVRPRESKVNNAFPRENCSIKWIFKHKLKVAGLIHRCKYAHATFKCKDSPFWKWSIGLLGKWHPDYGGIDCGLTGVYAYIQLPMHEPRNPLVHLVHPDVI